MDAKKKDNYRRRSSFFQRRLSTHGEPDASIDVRDSEHQGISHQCNEEEESKLIEYISKLKSEKNDWKKLVERLKKENSEFKQKSPSVIDHSCSWELLTEDDKQFLQGRVDYVRLGRLLDSTAEAIVMRHKQTAAVTTKLAAQVEDCLRSISDVSSDLIWRSLHWFDELDLYCEPSYSDHDMYNSNCNSFIHD